MFRDGQGEILDFSSNRRLKISQHFTFLHFPSLGLIYYDFTIAVGTSSLGCNRGNAWTGKALLTARQKSNFWQVVPWNVFLMSRSVGPRSLFFPPASPGNSFKRREQRALAGTCPLASLSLDGNVASGPWCPGQFCCEGGEDPACFAAFQRSLSGSG